MTLKFTPDHEWLQLEDNGVATVGITVHAQDALGDIVFVDLPEVGKTYVRGEVAGVVESVKAAADVYMPIDGTVTEVNEELRADPALANNTQHVLFVGSSDSDVTGNELAAVFEFGKAGACGSDGYGHGNQSVSA